MRSVHVAGWCLLLVVCADSCLFHNRHRTIHVIRPYPATTVVVNFPPRPHPLPRSAADGPTHCLIDACYLELDYPNVSLQTHHLLTKMWEPCSEGCILNASGPACSDLIITKYVLSPPEGLQCGEEWAPRMISLTDSATAPPSTGATNKNPINKLNIVIPAIAPSATQQGHHSIKPSRDDINLSGLSERPPDPVYNEREAKNAKTNISQPHLIKPTHNERGEADENAVSVSRDSDDDVVGYEQRGNSGKTTQEFSNSFIDGKEMGKSRLDKSPSLRKFNTSQEIVGGGDSLTHSDTVIFRMFHTDSLTNRSTRTYLKHTHALTNHNRSREFPGNTLLHRNANNTLKENIDRQDTESELRTDLLRGRGVRTSKQELAAKRSTRANTSSGTKRNPIYNSQVVAPNTTSVVNEGSVVPDSPLTRTGKANEFLGQENNAAMHQDSRATEQMILIQESHNTPGSLKADHLPPRRVPAGGDKPPRPPNNEATTSHTHFYGESSRQVPAVGIGVYVPPSPAITDHKLVIKYGISTPRLNDHNPPENFYPHGFLEALLMGKTLRNSDVKIPQTTLRAPQESLHRRTNTNKAATKPISSTSSPMTTADSHTAARHNGRLSGGTTLQKVNIPTMSRQHQDATTSHDFWDILEGTNGPETANGLVDVTLPQVRSPPSLVHSSKVIVDKNLERVKVKEGEPRGPAKSHETQVWAWGWVMVVVVVMVVVALVLTVAVISLVWSGLEFM